MYVTTCEKDAKRIPIERESLVEILTRQEDREWHEVIPRNDNNMLVRAYFDIDVPLPKAYASHILNTVMAHINYVFSTTNEDWAIASCHRDTKVSFHILSRKYTLPIYLLNDVAVRLSKNKCPGIDLSVYMGVWGEQKDACMRLPWQSKRNAISGEAPPLIIESGTAADFLITSTDGLKELEYKMPAGRKRV